MKKVKKDNRIDDLIFDVLKKNDRVDTQAVPCSVCGKERSWTVDFDSGDDYCFTCAQREPKSRKSAKDRLRELMQ